MSEQYYYHTASLFLAIIGFGVVCFLDTCAQPLCQYAQVSCQGLRKQLAFPCHAITIVYLFSLCLSATNSWLKAKPATSLPFAKKDTSKLESWNTPF